MQATTDWRAPTGPLGRLTERSYERAAALAPRRAELRARAVEAPVPPAFAAALRRADVAVIAEIKRRSPSKGEINPTLGAADQAARYERGGAAALSVLTEPTEFGGSLDDLAAARSACALPLLRKDFIVDVTQLAEARALGASAALLIARALPPSLLGELAHAARELGLDALVEVRDEDEIATAIALRPALIGINNRNLETLVIDVATSERIVPLVPASFVAIAESGVSGRADVERAARAGADAVLVGSSLSASADPVAALRALTGVAVSRGGRAAR